MKTTFDSELFTESLYLCQKCQYSRPKNDLDRLIVSFGSYFGPPGANFIYIYTRLFCTEFWCQSQNITRKSCQKRRLYKQSTWKMLMKLTPGLNFINVLRTAFTLTDPESVKDTDDLTVFFYPLGIYVCKSCT